ncbi:MAG: peptidylprolyl isomerase [Myxococcota bacterium]|jgi:peptidyl-prolyl cis-trans isomerase A (cyclophilin A)
MKQSLSTVALTALLLVPAVASAQDGKFSKLAQAGHDLYATISTNHGDIVVQLFPKDAPKTVLNFVSLAAGERQYVGVDGRPTSKPFYDGVTFHRCIEGFMIQGGDPTGTGRGGPGYQFEDEFQSGRAFDTPGLLAMANSGPNTNGSQFFITVSTPTYLNGKHTIFGKVIAGYDVAVAISKLGKGPGNRPDPAVVMKKVTISEKAPVTKKARAPKQGGT